MGVDGGDTLLPFHKDHAAVVIEVSKLLGFAFGGKVVGIQGPVQVHEVGGIAAKEFRVVCLDFGQDFRRYFARANQDEAPGFILVNDGLFFLLAGQFKKFPQLIIKLINQCLPLLRRLHPQHFQHRVVQFPAVVHIQFALVR